MRSLFARLPQSLLLVSLAVVSNIAAPVEGSELLVLNAKNFDKEIAKGLWFVEHFSPYCGHCRAFAPTWEKLASHFAEMDSPGIRLAQVNCITDGDLCNEHKVSGYPQMLLYTDGQMTEDYRGSRQYEILIKWLSERAEPSKGPYVGESKVEVPDPSRINPAGQVVALNPKSFQSTIDSGPTFVKFFAPWCGHCKKLKQPWMTLAERMKGKMNVVEVDCEQYGGLCKVHGVQGYPTLAFFDQGRKTEYSGGRTVEKMETFATNAVSPTVTDISDLAQWTEFVDAHDVVYLLIHDGSEIKNSVAKAARPLFGDPPVAATTSNQIRTHFDLNSGSYLVAVKDGNKAETLALHTSGQPDIEGWMRKSRLPNSAALDADSFPRIMAADNHPLIVLTVGHDPAIVKALGAAWRHRINKGLTTAQRDIVYTWMDGQRWSKWLKSMYGIKSGSKAVVVTDHKRLVYWDVDSQQSPLKLEESLFAIIEGAAAGSLPYKNSENVFERFARSVNNRMVAIEHYVTENPKNTLLGVIGVILLIGFLIKRYVVDVEMPADYYSATDKAAGRRD